MSADITITEKSRRGVVLVPSSSLMKDGGAVYCMIRQGSSEGKAVPVRRDVVTGLSDENSTEIVSGIKEGDIILMSAKQFSVPQAKAMNSFMPAPGRKK